MGAVELAGVTEARPFAVDAPVLLGGPPGVGKTTVGRGLADRLGLAFDDLDDLVAAAAGRTVREVFATEGEAGFRRRERAALVEVLDHPRRRVVALGGGALVDPAMRRRALDRGLVVGLAAAPSVLLERLARTPGARPLLEGDRGDREDREDASGGGLAARLGALLAARREAYAATHVTLDASRAASIVAGDAARAVQDRFAWVAARAGGYPVRLGSDAGLGASDAAFALGPGGLIVLSDERVGPIWAGAVASALSAAGRPLAGVITFAAGEEHKRLATVEHLAGALLERGTDRRSAIVAVGGGVVSDLAGFLAALYFRGLPWISVPTTLLGMVDAAVGGKTGVDLAHAKNVLGAFHAPRAVIVDPAHTRTEPPSQVRAGLAEAVKSGLVGDPELLAILERAPEVALDGGALAEVVARSLAVKIGIVGRDELEGGERMHLNLGHTFGHAVEAAAGFGALSHGEAVSIGLVAALRVGEDRGVTARGLATRIERLLTRLGLPTSATPGLASEAASRVGSDKKRAGAAMRFVAVREPGDVTVVEWELERLSADLAAAAAR